MANDSSSDQLSDYYQALEHQAKLEREAANAERIRIINLLLDQNIIRRDVTGKLVAFNTHGTEVVYIKDLEEK